MSDSCNPMDYSQAPLSMGFSRQEYWSMLPFLSPEDLHDPGSNPGLLLCRQVLYWLNYEGSNTLKIVFKLRWSPNNLFFLYVSSMFAHFPFFSPFNLIWMWELDYKESWALKNWCFWTVVLEKTLESPLDCKEIQPVHP